MRHSRNFTRFFLLHLLFLFLFLFFFSSTKLKMSVDTFFSSSYFSYFSFLSTYSFSSSISSITSFLFCHDSISFHSSIRARRFYSLFIKNTNHWQAEQKSKHWKRSDIDQISRNRWMRVSRMILKWRFMRTQKIQSKSYASR